MAPSIFTSNPTAISTSTLSNETIRSTHMPTHNTHTFAYAFSRPTQTCHVDQHSFGTQQYDPTILKQRKWKSFTDRQMQVSTFLQWVNYHLKSSGKLIHDLSAFSDGETIVNLVEGITCQQVPSHMTVIPPEGMRDKILNFMKSFHFLSTKMNITLSNIPVPLILNNNLKAIEDMCWEIIYNLDVNPVSYFGIRDRFALLKWFQESTIHYQNIRIVDFTQSFSNGLAFCALLHANKPSAINYSVLHDYLAIQNLNLAFDLLYKHFGVPKLLEAKDVRENPEELSIIIYLAQCYKFICSSMQK
eukprot:TRINITY_DN4232_c0_g1_i48.p1 TRINITY_DN4232_c0_g1~~TRINITY_DN4232_c0_g1_i48.p1  ORF type:complete len:302 (+),score=41.20 TRINITY_DN4232_c0_g1_i48:349-1254(+)